DRAVDLGLVPVTGAQPDRAQAALTPPLAHEQQRLVDRVESGHADESRSRPGYDAEERVKNDTLFPQGRNRGNLWERPLQNRTIRDARGRRGVSDAGVSGAISSGADLLAAVRGGDSSAFAELYER